MFKPEVYNQRREELKRSMEGDNGIVVFLGNREIPMNYEDNPYPFRQDSSFLYYFGLDGLEFDAAIDLDNGTDTLFGREGTLEDRIWMGARPALAEEAERIGVSHIEPPSKLEDVLCDARDKGRTVHYLPPYRSEHLLRLQDLLGMRAADAKDLASVDLIRAVVAQRSIKSIDEIAEIEAALAG